MGNVNNCLHLRFTQAGATGALEFVPFPCLGQYCGFTQAGDFPKW